ncbi:Aspyridones efflux protein apdF [Ceratocystis lukuohia]|uniref:Aspyridones efflux protein apdF n=1 Tax=Ceratocystis lukuohia TaxID=2019550 RepID=A0ABR4MQI4_9PEZI
MAREPVPPSVARNCDTHPQAIAEQRSDIESGSDGVAKVAGITTQYDKEVYEADPDNITSANCNPNTNDSKGHVDGSSVIEKVLSRVVSQKTLTDPGPPPDGGLRAWLVVLGGHLVVMNTWGVIVSFGIFQTYYTSSLGKSRFAISWIGSSQIFLLFFVAIGITACGTATGGLVFPSIARMMLPEHGVGWTLRTMGFVQLVSLIVAFFLVKPRIPPRTSGRLVEWAAFKDLAYTYYTVGNFFCFLGLYFAFHYLSSFSRSNVTPPLTYEGSLDLLMILNGVGIAGRIFPNYVSDSVGLLNMYIPLSFLSGVLILFWMAVTTRDGIYAWSIFYGIFAAGVQGLFPAGLSTLTPDLSKQGSRIGMAFTIVSFAVLAGPPIEGGLIQAMNGKYYAAQVFAGGCTIIGSVFIFAARMVKAKSVQKPGQSIWKMRV